MTFEARVDRYRRELHVHCYRMLGSFDDAEDAVQETLLRAWRSRDSLEREEWLRAWLYKIATNACLDAIRRDGRRVGAVSSPADVPWLQPYPDELLEPVAPAADEPDAAVGARETIELAFLGVMQLLPARQRGVLTLREVLGFSASDVAGMLDTNVAAVNSALQRARATLRRSLPPDRRDEWSVDAPTAGELEVLQEFIDANERGDVDAALALMTEDIRVTMPPLELLFEGREQVGSLVVRALGPEAPGRWRLVATAANRQPAAASYLQAPGETPARAYKIDVLRVRGGRIAEITTFPSDRFAAFALPEFIER